MCIRDRLGEQRGAGLDAVGDEGGQQQRRGRGEGQAQREQRNKGGGRCRVVGGFRAGYAFDRAVAELLGVLGDFLLQSIGRKGGQRPCRAGDQADEEAEHLSLIHI